ncbi:MAG: hypothetical protein D6730_16640 [Bacteroidetes bacterium]|nr:MAG: hypothetical protein D6730_16640 [Bacteroidota bacterium]
MKQVLITLVALLCLLLPQSRAQDYQTALGMRIGPYYGLTFKHFLAETSALELILITRSRGAGFTGLYEIHRPLLDVSGLRAYGGIGGHVNVFRYRPKNDSPWNWDNDQEGDGLVLGDAYRMQIGMDMLLGVEYKIEDFPFNLSLDWKPALNLIGDQGLSADQVAISIRFVFEE